MDSINKACFTLGGQNRANADNLHKQPLLSYAVFMFICHNECL